MNASTKAEFPDKETEEIVKKLKETEREFIRIEATKVDKLELWESKFFGLPYMPKDFKYPKNKDGTPLQLLAQINLEDLPSQDKLPQKGILQFFLIANDVLGWTSGIETKFQKNNSNFKIIYHKEVDKDSSKLENDFSFVPKFEKGYFPSKYKFALDFSKDTEHMSECDFRYVNYVPYEYESQRGFNMEFLEEFDIRNGFYNHKLFGYPFFTQADPRGDGRKLKDYELLFQMNSQQNPDTDEWEIIWGDVGVGNFFIKDEDLKKLDFSEAYFTWDCS